MKTFVEKSMPAVFQNRVRLYAKKTCVAFKNSNGAYDEKSWDEMNDMIRNLGYFLIEKGVKPGDKIALFSPNRYEWWIADMAILSIGAVNVPIYATNSAEECQYVIEDSDARMCLTGTKEHTDKILEVKDRLSNLELIISFEDIKNGSDIITDLAFAYEQGKIKPAREEFDKRITSIDSSDAATIIYTSGTTGNPKGVMLSHNNFFVNVKQCYNVDPDVFANGPEMTALSFLPLAHSFERTVGYYLAISYGVTVYFAEDFSKILENLQEVRPNCIVSVPRLYEKIHAGILAKVSGAPPIKKALFNWAMGVAEDNLPYICNDRSRTGLFSFKYLLANKIIFSKIKAALGMDNLKFAFSGGGPLSVSDAEFFLGMDIKVLEGYGLTETSPVTNANSPKKIKPGTIGRSVKYTQIKLGEGGELLIKGPQVMMGYYKDEKATKDAFTPDGFFRTGDIATIDEEGFAKITGRIKDIIITSGGKNISPQNIENSIKASPYIEQAAIIGENRRYLSALVVPSFPDLEKWAKDGGITFNSTKDLVRNPSVNELIAKEIEEHTKKFARVEQIRRFTLLETEWSQATDELTPTLKLKRRVINNKYSSIIEGMYPKE